MGYWQSRQRFLSVIIFKFPLPKQLLSFHVRQYVHCHWLLTSSFSDAEDSWGGGSVTLSGVRTGHAGEGLPCLHGSQIHAVNLVLLFIFVAGRGVM